MKRREQYDRAAHGANADPQVPWLVLDLLRLIAERVGERERPPKPPIPRSLEYERAIAEHNERCGIVE